MVKILKFIDDMILSRYTEYVGDCTPIDMRFSQNARALAILSPVLFYYILLKIKAICCLSVVFSVFHSFL